ncbi:OprO/OprP family phosphate-selective porin [Phenylobacterium aquaticum]|uniref:OprO/OprP family phosphate-selective porin n=1 Tax=Phenylobacterium aquaticum TaxID=1763816 RepID=UPI0026F18680|nr:porin [Phenylobacterium aquaticum]
MTTKIALCASVALCVSLLGATAASAQDTTVAWKGAPQWTNDDVQFKVRGRLLMDYVYQDVNREAPLSDYKTSNIRGRQAFLGIEGKLNSYIAYKAEGGAVNGGAWAWDDVVIEFKPTEYTSIMVGNIKAAGIENLTSTRFISFMDRGPYGDLGPDSYLASVVGKANGLNWTLTGAIQGNSINSADVNNTSTANPGSKERVGWTVRGTYAPILTDADKVHLGAFARVRNHGDESGFAYAGRPSTNYGDSGRYYTTGGIGNTDTTYGVEGAWLHNNFSVQGEYADIKVNRLKTVAPGTDPDIKVGYAYVSFWPTGESRNYDATKGEFARPKIIDPITAGGLGGVELLARYDYADLTEAYKTAGTTAARTLSQDAGKYTGWTLGANYYPTSYVRLQANFTKADINNPGPGRDVKINQFQMRAQLDF